MIHTVILFAWALRSIGDFVGGDLHVFYVVSLSEDIDLK
jgi:hypothetical protein